MLEFNVNELKFLYRLVLDDLKLVELENSNETEVIDSRTRILDKLVDELRIVNSTIENKHNT